MTNLVTVSGNFDNKKSWSGLKKHLKHDEAVHHKNKYLELDQSKKDRKFNQHIVLENFDDWTEKTFGDYVKKHDAKEERESRKYKSVRRFLQVDSRGRKRKTNIDLNYVAKFSDEENWHKYLKVVEKSIKKEHLKKKLSDEQIHAFVMKAVADGFADWADGFNERNPNLKMFESYIHMDEKGSPHSHNRIMPIVYREGKKPLTSLNTALAKQYGLPRNGKLLLSKFRKQEDTALIDSIEKTVKKELHINSDFKLLRKSDENKDVVTSVSHDEYVHNQEILDEQNKQIKENQATLDNQNNQITVANSTLNLTNKKVENARKAQKEAEESKEDTIKATTQEALKNAQNAKESYLKQLDDYKQELDERAKKQKEKEDELAKREKQLENKEQFIKNVEKSFWAGFYNQNVEDIDVDTAKDVYNDLKRKSNSDEKFINDALNSFKNAVVYTVADLTHLDFDNLNNAINDELHEPSQQQQKRQKQQNNDLDL